MKVSHTTLIHCIFPWCHESLIFYTDWLLHTFLKEFTNQTRKNCTTKEAIYEYHYFFKNKAFPTNELTKDSLSTCMKTEKNFSRLADGQQENARLAVV